MPSPRVTAAAVIALALLAWYSGNGGWEIYAGLAVCLLLAVRCLFSEPLLLLAYRPRRADQGLDRELWGVATTLSEQVRLPPPRLYVIDSPIPNALAAGCGNHSVIAVTSSLLGLLDRQELAGVIGHELAHLEAGPGRHLDLFAAPLYGGMGLLADLARRAMVLGATGAPAGRPRGALVALLARTAAALGQKIRCRSGELEADARGAQICGDPLWLARALRKLAPYEAGLSPNGALGPGLHPPLGERIRRLEAKAYGAYM